MNSLLSIYLIGLVVYIIFLILYLWIRAKFVDVDNLNGEGLLGIALLIVYPLVIIFVIMVFILVVMFATSSSIIKQIHKLSNKRKKNES